MMNKYILLLHMWYCHFVFINHILVPDYLFRAMDITFFVEKQKTFMNLEYLYQCYDLKNYSTNCCIKRTLIDCYN